MHVLMLHRKFELIPIKTGFFMNFSSCSKCHVLYFSTGQLIKHAAYLVCFVGNPAPNYLLLQL